MSASAFSDGAAIRDLFTQVYLERQANVYLLLLSWSGKTGRGIATSVDVKRQLDVG